MLDSIECVPSGVLCLQRKCEQYWSDNIGEVFETQDKKMEITTTSSMPFADFEIRTFNLKHVSGEIIFLHNTPTHTLTH